MGIIIVLRSLTEYRLSHSEAEDFGNAPDSQKYLFLQSDI
jgi:hypothetical protein